MATTTERKFTGLRKRLDQLGYRQSLGIESLPLVDKLFGDLLHTTESLRSAKQQLGKHKEEKGVWEQHVEPYRVDNARVIKDNNSLHQKLIKLKENADQKTREMKAVLRRLEHENTDLKFLNTQYLQRLRTQEKDSEKKTEKILELQEKNFQAVIQTPGGKKKHIPFRRQRMEIDSTLPQCAESNMKVVLAPPTPDPYVANLLHVADQKMAELQAMVEEGRKERGKLEESLHCMRQQVEHREEEILRLGGMLKGGRPAEALAAEGMRESKERMVAHLNIQVDFLQQASRELEKKLGTSEACKAELEERVKELASKNARICSELQEIGELVKQMESERTQSEEELKRKLKELETEKLAVIESLREMEEKIQQLGTEKTELFEDNQRIAQHLATSEGDRKGVGSILERLSEERKNFQRQCRQFKEKESIMQQRISELESKPSAVLHSSTGGEVRKLKKERNDLKDAVSNFETELLQIQMDAKVLADDRDNFKLLYEQMSEELSRARHHGRAPSGSPGAALIRRMEGERDHALLELQQKKTECSSLQDRLHSLQSTQQHDLKTLEDQLSELQVQLEENTSEKEELSKRLSSTKELLASMEAELQNSTLSLAAANGELVRHRSKVSQLQALVEASERTRQGQEKGMKDQSLTAQTAQYNVAALNSKIVKLNYDLSEKDEKISELRHALTMLDQDHDHLVSEADKKDEAIASLTEQLEQKESSLLEAGARLVQFESDLTAARERHGSKEKEITRTEVALESARNEVEISREQINGLTQKIVDLRSDLNTMTQENQAIHEELSRAVREKESLELKVEEYAQTLLRYEEGVALKEQEKAELIDAYQNLNKEADRLNSTLKDTQEAFSKTKMELLAASQVNKQLEGLIEEQNHEIQMLRTYEQQLSNMSHALSKMEGVLRQEQQEKKALMSDMEATRELCVQLDRSKDSLSTQLSTQSLQYDQVQSRIADTIAERDLIMAQLESERKTTEQLQTLLSNERQKEFQSHVAGKEKEEEIHHLRQLLAKIEADRLSLAEQTRKLRGETAVQSESLQRLKTELTSEKFQKEHMRQQLDTQRYSLTMLTSPKLHSNARTPSPPRHHAGRGGTSPPLPVLPNEPALSSPQSDPSHSSDPSQPPDSLEEDQFFSKESAKVVGQLLRSPSSSSSDNTAHTSTKQ